MKKELMGPMILVALFLFFSGTGQAKELLISVSPKKIESNTRDVAAGTIVDLTIKIQNVASSFQPFWRSPLSIQIQQLQGTKGFPLALKKDGLHIGPKDQKNFWGLVQRPNGILDLVPAFNGSAVLEAGATLTVDVSDLTIVTGERCPENSALSVKILGKLVDSRTRQKFEPDQTEFHIPIRCRVKPEVSRAKFVPKSVEVGESAILNFTATGAQRVWVNTGKGTQRRIGATDPGRHVVCHRGPFKPCRSIGTEETPTAGLIRVTPSDDFDLDVNKKTNVVVYRVYAGSDSGEYDEISEPKPVAITVRMPTLDGPRFIDQNRKLFPQPAWLTKQDGKSREVIDLFLEYEAEDAKEVRFYCRTDPHQPYRPIKAPDGSLNVIGKSPLQVDMNVCHHEKNRGRVIQFLSEVISSEYKRIKMEAFYLRPMQVKSWISSPSNRPKVCESSVLGRDECINRLHFEVRGGRLLEVELADYHNETRSDIFGFPVLFIEKGNCIARFYGPGPRPRVEEHLFEMRAIEKLTDYAPLCDNRPERCCRLDGTPPGIARYK